MQFTIEKNDFVEALTQAKTAISQKCALPILSCYYLKAEGTTLTVWGSDIVTSIMSSAPIFTAEPGEACIDAKTLLGIVKKLPDDTITVSSNEASFKLSVKKLKFDIPVQNAEDFPLPRPVQADEIMKVDQNALKDALNGVVFAAAVEEGNKILTSVNMKVLEDSTLLFTALDGHRIAQRKVALSNEASPSVKEINVPAKVCGDLVKLLTDGEAEVSFTESAFKITTDAFSLSAQTIAGQYMNASQLMEGTYPTKLTLNRQAFMNLLDRSMLLTTTGSKRPVVFDIGNDGLHSSVKTERGYLTEDLDATLDGKTMTQGIGFNPRFLMDSLKAISDEKVTLNIRNPKSPCTIFGDTYKYLVLPVNFSR